MTHCTTFQSVAKDASRGIASPAAPAAREPARVNKSANRKSDAVSTDSTTERPSLAQSGRVSAASYITFIAAVTARKTADTAHSEPTASTAFRSQEFGIRLATSG